MLTPLELDIMKAVWRQPPITVRAVQDDIRPGRKLAYTTVMTIMDRLYHKGFLKRTLLSRTHYYEPAIDFTQVRDEAVETLIKAFFGSKEKLKEFLEGSINELIPLPPLNAAVSSRKAGDGALDETLL
jgi:predicted transcriptional regulator